jgi:DNA-directed RNA polymerase I subunit RPA34.5
LETLTGGLAGKQVWHITAPASIPLDAIKEFNVDAVRNGNPILTHSERQYGFTSGPKDVQEDLLLPGGSELTYKRLRMSVSKSYHLQEIPAHSQTGRAPSDQSSKANCFFANEIPESKTPRKQPEMLKMRYKPFGTDESSSTSMTIQQRSSPEERESQAPPQPLSQLPESTPKKRKKHKRPVQSKQNGLADDPMETDGTPTQATMVQEPSPQTDLSFSELPARVNSIDEHKGTLGKKKKKKKIRDEQPS